MKLSSLSVKVRLFPMLNLPAQFEPAKKIAHHQHYRFKISQAALISAHAAGNDGATWTEL